jgi:RNA polymerase sigma-70 factor (ECF subfamily)
VIRWGRVRTSDHEGLMLGSAAVAVERPDETRLRRLFDTHFEYVWRLVRRLGVVDALVDDATQQVFCVVAERLNDVEPRSEKAFLTGTAVRVAANHRRAQRRRLEVPEDEASSEPVDPERNPEDLVQLRRERELLDRVLDGLASELRAPFVLHELEDATLTEIAELLGIPRGTAASRLRRARAQFQAAVQALTERSR